jgi:sugar lactone lactonase YvrE
MRTAQSWAFVLLLLGLVACGGARPTGSLQVAVGGLPAGVPAAIAIQGPGGYAEVVTETRLLHGLVPGAYTVNPVAVAREHTIVPATYDATASSSVVTVEAGATATATVDHAWRSPTGRAWIARSENDGPILSGFDGDDLLATGAPAPAASVGRASGMWEGIAFDAHGNAWIARYQHGTRLVRFPAGALAASGPTVPDVVIDATDPLVLGDPVGLAFDAQGGLWVAGFDSNTLVRFAPAQLAASGSPTPEVVVSATAGSLSRPTGLAFDAAGALWVANQGNDSVVAFGSGKLGVSGALAPDVVITSTSGRLFGPFDLAFDPNGSLWVSALWSGLVRYEAEQLSTGGSPTPSAWVTEIGTPKGLAFDHRGDLWVNVRLPGRDVLVRLADPHALTMTGPAVFATTIDLGFDVDGGFISFFPPPPGVPIRTP